jgi:large subunit ribosomal protein L18e
MIDKDSALAAAKSAARSSRKPVYRQAVKMLSRKTNRLVEVNVGKLDNMSSEGSVLLVPGKVLGEGDVTKELHVGAVAYTTSAAQKISSAGGEALLLKDFVAKYGEGKGVLLVGG